MTDIEHLLDNRVDWEKLEQDIAAVEDLLAEGALGPDIQERVREARQALESARAAHTDLCQRLVSQAPLERAAARLELSRRVDAGELKIFDPDVMHWRPPADLTIKALRQEEALERQEIEQRQFEQSFRAAVEAPNNLYELENSIRRAEELERIQALSNTGMETLQKARLLLVEGLKKHRETTLNVHFGNLKERCEALENIKKMIAVGETHIVDAPDDKWRPAGELLAIAEREYQQASDRQTTDILDQSETLARTDANAALRTLYLAMDKNAPFTDIDRRRLESRYHELFAQVIQIKDELSGDEELSKQFSTSDLEGFRTVRSAYQKKIEDLFDHSVDWLNQFFRSALTRNSTGLLDEADLETTPVAKSIDLIDMAESLARNALEGSIEIPEVLVCGAAILLKKGEPDRARELLARAKPLYTLERIDKVHRYAVVAWLQGCTEYYLGHRFPGYTEWKIARNYFKDLSIAAHREKQADKEKWYRARLLEMETQAIQTYEEIYFTWMNQFDMPQLTAALFEYRHIMDSQLAKKQILELKKTIQIVLNISKRESEPEIYWLMLAEVAFYEYQIRDFMAAIMHLNRAAIGFQATHRGAVCLWLLGMIRWWLPGQRRKGMQNWEASIHLFQELSHLADKTNQQNQRNWYENQIALMETSLKQWVIMTQPRS